jgi:cytochrome c oxidase accessory protein FixG
MCPYARFQSVMFDRDTLVITYDRERGDPRGGRSKSVDPRAKGLGDCVDCGICVQVCPTGIDIRNGLQHECIGCAACIDACDQVMDRMGYARGLIRYTTQNALDRHWSRLEQWRRALRPRTIAYSVVLLAIVGVAAWSLATRIPLRVDVIRDRGALARETVPGQIENVYRVQIMNTDETSRRYIVSADGLPGLEVAGVSQPVELDPAAPRLIAGRLGARRAPHGMLPPGPGTHRVDITVRAVDDPHVVRHEQSTFIIPR